MRLAWAIGISLLACSEPVTQPATIDRGDQPIGDANRGAELVVVYECARCHVGVGDAPDLQKQCAGCHEDILDGTLEVPEGERWRDTIHSLPSAPQLGAAERFEPRWIAEYLQAPHDLRPNLEATMPGSRSTSATPATWPRT